MGRIAPRSAVEARVATPHDIPVLVGLHIHLGSTGLPKVRRGRVQPPGPYEAEAVEAGFAAALQDPDKRVLLATLGAEPVGFALVMLVAVNPLLPETVVRIGPIVVAPQARRRGAGRALVAAAGAWGEERGAASATVGLRPADREGNRYFARLGFVALEVRRVAPLALLRRQLGQANGVEALHRRSPGLTPVLRRRLRTREQPLAAVARRPADN